MKMFLAAAQLTLGAYVTVYFQLYPGATFCNALPQPSGSEAGTQCTQWLQHGGSDIMHHADFREFASTAAQTLFRM